MQTLTITTISPQYFAALEALQRACYPTLDAQELMRVEHYASQYSIFPEGQIVVLDGERVIGQGSGFFIDFDFGNPDHRFNEICDGFYFRNHSPQGAYYYGADISVHPRLSGTRHRQVALPCTQGPGATLQQARHCGRRRAAGLCAL